MRKLDSSVPKRKEVKREWSVVELLTIEVSFEVAVEGGSWCCDADVGMSVLSWFATR
jgi:hypothetical protein